ncbi:MAG: DsrE family protein [Verrucomicrobia bacterium]|nr:DsrE family protein [Verrucomicrobiota bacterium]
MSNPPDNTSTVILVNNDGMGKSEPPLQHKLMQTYLRLLDETNHMPKAICFYADGVKLVVEGSPVLEQLRALEAKGVLLLICQTCLNYFGLIEKVRVGIVGGMPDIIAAQWRAQKVITI